MAVRGVIVGAGRAGTHLHYGAHLAAGAEIVAFVDANLPLAKAAAARFGVRDAFASLDEALGKCGKLDFVDICTVSSTHFQLTKAAVEAGCHVLVEKPLTETSEELEAMKTLRQRSGRAICAVHNHKYYPAMVRLRSLIDSGELGEIKSIHKEFMFNRETARMMEAGHWAHKIPGGRLFEANPHNLYLLYELTGGLELWDIRARKTSDRWPHAGIDEFTAVLGNGSITATIRMSLYAETAGYGKHGPNFFIITGTRKSIYADYDRVEAINPSKGLLDRIRERFLGKEAAAKAPALLDKEGKPINVGIGSGHFWLIERFDGFLAGKYASEPIPFEEAYFTQKMNLEMGMRVETIMSGAGPQSAGARIPQLALAGG